jgi:pSer/pThr/pTyr-binding forkhead associated (FHA) protein/ribosomal protein S27E
MSINKQNDSQRVKCPQCGHADSVLNFPSPQRKQVQCPQCKTVLSIYAMAKGVLSCPNCKYQADITSYRSPGQSQEEDSSADEFVTNPNTMPGINGQLLKPGILKLVDGEFACTPNIIRLQRGVNTVGRNASSSQASIRLNTQDHYMSRIHVRIELIMKSDGTFIHNLSDAGSQNATWHNDEKLEKGDQIVLKPGDIIKLGHTVFEFKDEEK